MFSKGKKPKPRKHIESENNKWVDILSWYRALANLLLKGYLCFKMGLSQEKAIERGGNESA